MSISSVISNRRINLVRLINERYAGSQSNFASVTKISLSQIGQWLASEDSPHLRNMSERSARKIEDRAGLPDGWMDSDPNKDSSFESLQDSTEEMAVFEMLDAKAACGNGALVSDHPEVVSMMSMPIGMAQSLLGTANKVGAVKIVSAANDSMAPTIEPDDLLFVDTSISEYVSEGVYLLVHDGNLICKRLSRPGKDIIVSSDNPHYKSWNWQERPDQTRIVGRVLRALPIQFKKFSGD